MKEIGTVTHPSHRKHLLTHEEVTRSAGTSGDADLTRSHGQGNGVRVHGLYFAAVSLAALALVIAAIVLATTMR